MIKIAQGEVPGLDQNGNHFALIRFGGNPNPGGVSLEGICNDSLYMRVSANRYYNFADDLFTAMVSKYINAVLHYTLIKTNKSLILVDIGS